MLASTHTFGAGPLRGEITVPGDKSISHRALMLASLLEHPITVRGLNPGRDVRATSDAIIALEAAELTHEPVQIDCMNSGSTARMMLGICAGANRRAIFDGDESLRKRPMEPVAMQLRAFGARIHTTDGKLPLTIDGRTEPQTRSFILLSQSAQIKSALLLAGVAAQTPVTITNDGGSRDHTERMLRYLGADIISDGKRIELRTTQLRPRDIDVPGDLSAAAFFITAATLARDSDLTITGVNLNPTRMGIIDALSAMGANIEIINAREHCGEPLGSLRIRSATLTGTSIDPTLALRAIDELPLLAVAACFAHGSTRITGIRELRTKESDRVAAIERLCASVGIACETEPNGLTILGGTPKAGGGTITTEGDHRTAMAAAVLATAAGELSIDDASCIDVSFPEFIATMRSVQTT